MIGKFGDEKLDISFCRVVQSLFR